MKRVIPPVAVAAVIAVFLSLALFFLATARAGDLRSAGQHVLALGPVPLVEITRERSATEGSVSVVPGWGLLLADGLLLGYGVVVGLRRHAARRDVTV